MTKWLNRRQSLQQSWENSVEQLLTAKGTLNLFLKILSQQAKWSPWSVDCITNDDNAITLHFRTTSCPPGCRQFYWIVGFGGLAVFTKRRHSSVPQWCEQNQLDGITQSALHDVRLKIEFKWVIYQRRCGKYLHQSRINLLIFFLFNLVSFILSDLFLLAEQTLTRHDGGHHAFNQNLLFCYLRTHTEKKTS